MCSTRCATPPRIVTSALVPCRLLTAGALDWLSPPTVILTSEPYLFVRLALIGLVIDRLRARRTSRRTLLAGLVIALVAAGIALLKSLSAIGNVAMECLVRGGSRMDCVADLRASTRARVVGVRPTPHSLPPEPKFGRLLKTIH